MRFLIVVAAVLVSLASAQRCQAELTQQAGTLPLDTPPGVMAAELLATAVEMVEPALPPIAWGVQSTVDTSDYPAARYLQERRLLPEEWQPEVLTPEVWQEMLESFLSWYELDGVSTDGNVHVAGLVEDLSTVLDQVAGAVRPLILVASDAQDSSRVAFLGLVWNWTVYPRLIVLRPGDDLSLAEGAARLLDQVANCAVDLRHYVLAPEETALELFLTHADARMYVIGSEPQSSEWPLLVPNGEEQEYFGFRSPDVSDLSAFAAAFDGPSLGIGAMLRMLPRLRTNVPPTRLPGLLSTPVVDLD